MRSRIGRFFTIAAFALGLVACRTTEPTPVPTPTPTPESPERTHMTLIEVRDTYGIIIGMSNGVYYCPMLDCSISVYVTGPAIAGRTVTVAVESADYLLPPAAKTIPENGMSPGVQTQFLVVRLNPLKFQMTEHWQFIVTMTETSAAGIALNQESQVVKFFFG